MLDLLVENGRITDLACWLLILVLAIALLSWALRIPDDDVLEMHREVKRITKAAAKNKH